MVAQKKTSYRKALVRVLKSNALAPELRKIFEDMSKTLEAGQELPVHQQLWIEQTQDRLYPPR